LSCVKLSFANDYEFKILSPFTGNLDCTWKESSLQTLIEDSMWLVDPVEDSYDPTGGLPADPTVGDRYISDATANGWTIDYIYEWDGTSWVESIPEEGWMVWMLLDLLYYVFFSGGWMEVGAGSYLSLDGESINVTNGTFDLTTTGDISVGGVTVTSLTDGIATLTGGALSGSTIADGTTMATNGAPVADAGIANKKYVDDVVVAAGGAPIDATYITQTANGTLTAEQALTSLSDGIVKVNGTTGVLSTAIADTDYDSSTTNEINTITGDDSNSTTGLGITVAGSGINATTVAGNTVTVTATEADTLDTVSDRGSTTDQSITTGGYSDGIATLTGGALTGATGNISMFTNDSAYLTTLPFAGLSDYPANASGALTNDGAGALSWVVPAGSGDLKADGSVPLTADWNVGLFDITAVEFKGALKGNADTVTNATLTTALTVDTGTVGITGNAANNSVLTLAAGASSIEGSNTGDQDLSGKADVDQTMYIGTTGVAINRGTAALTLAGLTLTTPNIGTPSAGTLTNCTFPTLNQNTTGKADTAGNADTVTNGVYTTDFPLNQSTTGSAATLTTPRAINGVDFNGSAPITVTAAAGTLTGATLKSDVLASSLTSVGTIASLVATTADINAGTFDGVVGGTTPAAGSFTAITGTGTATFNDASNATVAEIVNDGTGDGLLITQNGVLASFSYGLEVYSNTAQTSSDLVTINQANASSTRDVLNFDNAGTGHGIYLNQAGVNATSKNGLYVYSNAAQVNSPLCFMKNDHASSTEEVLKVQQDGTGPAILVVADGTGPHFVLVSDPIVASPVDGAIWFDGTNLKIRVGATTYNINKTAE